MNPLKKFNEMRKKFGLNFAIYSVPIKILEKVDWVFSKKEGRELRKINNYLMELDWSRNGLNRELLIGGIREENATREFSKILSKRDIVLDLGANEGYYALLAAEKVKKVYAVEPVKENHTRLNKNIKINEYKNIEVIRLAVGDKNGKVEMKISDKANWCSVSNRIKRNGVNEVVKMNTLDTLLRTLKQKPNVLRMDLEGYEYELIGAIRNSWKYINKIMVELHFQYLDRDKIKTLFRLFRSKGFEIKCLCYNNESGDISSPRIRQIVDWINRKRIRPHFAGIIEDGFENILEDRDIIRGISGCPNMILEKKIKK